MRYPSGHKSNYAAGWHWRFASADADHHGQDARATRRANSIANRKSRMAPPSPLAPTTSWCPPKGEGTKRRETASGFVRNSSFIIHPSSFIFHPSSFIIHPFRRGVTLVEMLIVISIMVILMVGAFKVMQPLADRRVREAARAVNVYIASARNRAIEIGRPCGVIFRRATATNTPAAAMVLDQCEVPPPYAGDTTDAAVKIQKINLSPPTLIIQLRIQIRMNDFSDNLIRPGDLIRLNNQGPYYNISSPSYSDDFTVDATTGYFAFSAGTASAGSWIDSNYLTVTLDNQKTPMQSFPWPVGQWSSSVPFQILRQPMKSSHLTSRGGKS